MHKAFFALSVLGASLVLAGQKPMNPELSDEAVERRITQHRTAEVTLTVRGPDGRPLAGAPIVIRQTRHKFLFGCNAFRINTADSSPAQQQYQKRFAELLNYATLPFYWGSFERTEGKPETERLKMMARWCADNNIIVKGHPLCWHQVTPRWAREKTPEEIGPLQVARVTRDVTAFRGIVDIWDVVNEAVVMPKFNREPGPIPAWCAKVGPVEVIKQTFAAARAANPSATLVLNDFDTSPRYEKLIEDCLKAGVSIDVIGIQSHMHGGYWGADRAWDVCNRFARFGKPLHFTETTIISGDRKENMRWSGPPYDDWFSTPEGEKRQAEQVVEFYTVLFSHPAVQAITWWDFSDSGAWLGAPSGLVRKDMSPKPAYEELMKRIRGRWWTAEVKTTTDASGRAAFRGFLGDYSIQAGSAAGSFTIGAAGRCEAAVTVK